MPDSVPLLIGFLAAVALAYVVPGPDFAIILRYSARGRRWGRAAAFGVICGLCVHLTLAVLGLSALLAQSEVAFTVVKLVGAAYLILLGIQSLLAARKPNRPGGAEGAVAPGSGSPPRLRPAFVQGFLTNVLNPKAALFFLSLLPQFIDPAAPVLPQTALLGTITVAFGVGWWMLFVALTGRISEWLARSTVRRWLDGVTGVFFIGLGIRLARTDAV